MRITIGVLTVSGDTQVEESDEHIANAAVRALEHAGYHSVLTGTSPPEFAAIKGGILRMCESCDIVLTTGGTGFAPGDITPEVTATLLERQANGLAELIRLDSHRNHETSHLNRGVAGIRGSTVIINLPGSPDLIKQGIDAISLLLRPMLSALKGELATEHVG